MVTPRTWDCGIVGVNAPSETVRLSALTCAEGLPHALIETYGEDFWLTPPQQKAVQLGIFERDAHFLVSTPTNSGKTLIAALRIYHQAITQGRRSLYVTPLKAIAEEKCGEFKILSRHLYSTTGRRVKIRITTGDYQLTDDFLNDPPPKTGDIIICTPERLETILRNPDYHAWVSKIGNVVFDEIHLLGEEKRGPVVEAAMTRLRVIAPRLNMIGLSATVGGIDQLAGWLGSRIRPVVVIEDSWRFPPLYLKVVQVGDKNAYLERRIKEILQESKESVLVFAYRREDARKLAEAVAALGLVRPLSGEPDYPGEIGKLLRKGVGYFHAGLTLQQRQEVNKAYRIGHVRVVVATTSLKMGVNLPATNVFIRDHHFWGRGDLPVTDILQMLGRAGRGNEPGYGELLVDDEVTGEMYAQQLRARELPPLRPQMFAAASEDPWKPRNATEEQDRILQSLVLSEVVVRGRATPGQVEAFLKSTFSAYIHGFRVNVALVLSQLAQWHLIQKVEGSEDVYEARSLGRVTCLTAIHPQTGAALGGLLVGLLRLGEKEKDLDPSKEEGYLRRLRDLDLLFMVSAALEMRQFLLSSPGKRGVQHAQEYIERLDPEEKPVLNLWRSEVNRYRGPNRLLATLKVAIDSGRPGRAEQKFYQLMRTAILVHRHSRGVPLERLAGEYGMDEGTLEQGLKMTALWILSALAQICDSRKCYKLDFLMLRALNLIEKVKYGSGLAPLLRLEGIGKRTIQKLTKGGYTRPKDFEGSTEDGLRQHGLSHKQASKILKAMRKPRR